MAAIAIDLPVEVRRVGVNDVGQVAVANVYPIDLGGDDARCAVKGVRLDDQWV